MNWLRENLMVGCITLPTSFLAVVVVGLYAGYVMMPELENAVPGIIYVILTLAIMLLVGAILVPILWRIVDFMLEHDHIGRVRRDLARQRATAENAGSQKTS